MSHEKAQALYEATQAAEQQFEYFLTGAIGAVLAYMAQSYTPQRFGLTPYALEPIALICLAGAFYCGLKRIECLYHSLGINYERHQALGDAKVTEDAVRKILEEPQKYSPRSGMTIESIRNHAAAYRNRAQSAEPLLDTLNKKVRLLYSWRNRLLAAGFLLIVAARVLSPYFPTEK